MRILNITMHHPALSIASHLCTHLHPQTHRICALLRGITGFSLTDANARHEPELDLSYFTNTAAMLLPRGGLKLLHSA